MEPVERRSGPLTLRVGQRDTTLMSEEVNTLVEAMQTWRQALTKQLEQLMRDKPQTLQGASRRIGRLEQLEEMLLRTPSRLTDAPVELDPDQLDLLLESLGELTGYQRGDLTGGLRELKVALLAL